MLFRSENCYWWQKILTSVYSEPTGQLSLFRWYFVRVMQQKSIDGISTGVAKRIKGVWSNVSDFLEQLKKYSA